MKIVVVLNKSYTSLLLIVVLPTILKTKAAVARGACVEATKAASMNPGLELVPSASRRRGMMSSVSLSSELVA